LRRAIFVCALALAACGPQATTTAPAGDAVTQVLTPANLPVFFDCLRDQSQAVVSAHRGGPAPGFAENAIPTFEHTLSKGPALLEIDIARTSDDALVLMHDDDVDRTTDGTGAVSSLTLAQFQALSLQDETGATLDAHPPTLREALDWAEGKAVLELDVKRGVSYEDVVAAVNEEGAMDRVVFITYSVDGAERIHRIAPEAMIYTTVMDDDDLAELVASGIDLSRIIAWTGTREPNSALNLQLAARGIESRFGTLGRPDESWDSRFAREGAEQYAAFAETGIQVIATDRPAEAARDLDTHDGVDGYGALQCATAR
jgi:glycerophosphoryl diester phosphodiesterase